MLDFKLKGQSFLFQVFMLLLVCLASYSMAAHYDIYLVAGQSNAQGQNSYTDLPDPSVVNNPNIRYYQSTVLDGTLGGQWRTLTASSNTLFGPEIGLANRLEQLYPASNIAVIKHAMGSTGLDASMDSGNNWYPGTSPADSANFGYHFEVFQSTVSNALQALLDEGNTYTVKGMIWQQGERDSTTQATADAYDDNLNHFIARIREQFNAPEMNFTYGTILQGIDRTYESNIRQSQENVDQNSGHALSVQGAFLIDIDDVSVKSGDEIHIDAVAQIELGTRAADRLFCSQRVPDPV
jgi:hypothetical protein